MAALRLLDQPGSSPDWLAVNLGSGNPTSVLELVSIFRQVTGLDFEVTVGERRPGDTVGAVASPTTASTLLGWRTSLSIADAIRDALAWGRLRGWWPR